MKKYFCLLLFVIWVSPVFAADHYVSPNGSGSACSMQSPCTLAGAQKKAAAGDTILLRGGIYGRNQGIPFGMTKSRLTWKRYQNEKPVIDGGWALPEGENPGYRGLINIAKGADDVVIDGLVVKKSRGRGINAQFGYGTIVRNCNVSYTDVVGIAIGERGEDSHDMVDNCDVTYGNYCWDRGTCEDWSFIGQNIHVKGGHNIVRNSRVGYGAHAGIEGWLDYDTIIENNVVYGNHLTQIHVAGSKNAIIRDNVIYGTARESENPDAKWKNGYGDGLGIMMELWYDQSPNGWDQGHQVYRNVVANCIRNLNFGYQTGRNTSHKENRLRNIAIFNNTFLEPHLFLDGERQDPWNVGQCVMVTDDGYFGPGNVIKNNIFWSRDKMTAGNGANVDMDYNLWSSQPPASFRGPHDPTYGPLNMADYFSKTSGWYDDAVKYGDIVKADFALLGTAREAIDTGTDMGLPYEGAAPDCGALEYSSGGGGGGIDFFLVNASSGSTLGQIESGDTIYLRQVGNELNIRAEVNANAGQDKLRFVLDGAVVRTERTAPYALAGDDGNGHYNPWTPDTGTHTLEAVALDAGDNTVAQSTITFSVSNASVPDIILTLVDADTDTDLYELNDSDTIDLSTNSALNIRADVSAADNDSVDRVRFELDGAVVRTKQAESYTLAGDDGNGRHNPWTPSAGTHMLKVIVFDVGNNPVVQRTITFSVLSKP